jgi:cysteine desulfurase
MVPQTAIPAGKQTFVSNVIAIHTNIGVTSVNLSFSFIEGESFLMAMKDIALSSGSACTSASLEPSYVLRALGAQEDMAHSSIRFGIGRFTTEGEIDFVTSKIVDIVKRLRDLSPLWEMHQEGIDIASINWSQH